MMLPDCPTFTKEVREAIARGDALRERRYRRGRNRAIVRYSLLSGKNRFPKKGFSMCGLYALLKQLWTVDKVTSVDLRPSASDDTCNFIAMGNLLVYLNYATDDGFCGNSKAIRLINISCPCGRRSANSGGQEYLSTDHG